MRRLLLVLAATGSLLLPLGVSQPALAAAPGCTASRPTSIGGPIYGYPDLRSLNAVIGFDLQDINRKKVDRDGNLNTTSGYLYRERINPTIPPEGSDDRSLTRTWGDPATNGVFCVSSKVRYAYFEIYPQNAARYSVTTKTRYGAAAHHAQAITPGATHNITLRLPLRQELPGGITGYLNGYLSYQGAAIDPANITRMRMFPRSGGAACGVEGFSAAADQIGRSSTKPATYYRIDALAGGRCGQATQAYTMLVDCTCGGQKRTLSRIVEITTGKGTGLNLSFG